MTIPELTAEWPEVAALFDGPERPWRATVQSWNRPWRQLWGDRARAFEEAGVSPPEAEERAYEEVRALRDDPRPLAGTVAGGGAIVKDAVARPRMPSKRVTKAVRRHYRDADGGLFDGQEDAGRSTTYQMENRS